MFHRHLRALAVLDRYGRPRPPRHRSTAVRCSCGSTARSCSARQRLPSRLAVSVGCLLRPSGPPGRTGGVAGSRVLPLPPTQCNPRRSRAEGC